MDKSTVKKLNEINRTFYEEIATEFSDTRHQHWTGWLELIPLITQQFSQTSLTVLDVACGNGRFGIFLKEQLPQFQFSYMGIDSNQKLLGIAEAQLQPLYNKEVLRLIKKDIVEENFAEQADLIVAFGILHHIPSFELRVQFIQKLAACIKPGGLLIIAAWQFDQLENIFARRKTPEEVGLKATDLEENDFLLTWEREKSATRYAHLITNDEMDKLIALSDLKLVKEFVADGRNNSTNHYVVLEKAS